jgi:hypothetical protein
VTANTTAEIKDDVREATTPRLFEMETVESALSLSERFILPPFTQLDARSGAWQDRKALWLRLGLKSEVGRDAKTFAKGEGKDDVSQKILAMSGGQSIFDPVLAEMVYRWFTPKGGHILDPFAGGSVRGVVAAVCGRHYTGIDLSERQVDANIEQDASFRAMRVYGDGMAPTWLVGDSRAVLLDHEGYGISGPFDGILTCPPYHDLEVYSDDPRDLSNMPYKKFVRMYRDIFGAAIDRLAMDRFVVVVVGEIRGPDGFYRHFVQDTIDALELAGAAYYNEAILVSPAGTLPLRAAKQFVTSRKMGRTHQTVIVAVKGDARAATAACADVAAEEAALQAMGTAAANLADVPDEDYSGMGHG